ncbi:hypothetical protein AB0D12_33880 [Streptomyces sp. NPDC048479]|uniref:hypothetical protein n=1 Tax=Streptomyces sp. NPDC048479 TaxID=3154725 RepID=UPI003438F070
MTSSSPRSPRSPRLLLITTVVLAVVGMVFLSLPADGPSSSAAPSVPPATVPATHSALSTGSAPAKDGTPTAASPTEPASASELPPHGEGAAGDREIQKALEAAWPADLAAEDERQLLAAGRELLRADATGIGRAKWPGVFGDPDQAVAPAFASVRFRIQCAIARREGRDDRVVVHLVWAGVDRGGTYTDGRITDWHFTPTTAKGASTWTPQPRT